MSPRKKNEQPPPPPPDDDDLDDLQEEEEEIEETIEDNDDDAGDSITAPPFLKELIALPGIDANVLRGIDTGKAWVKIYSRVNGAETSMPLAHLAPDAIDVLGDLGFEGYSTFEIRNAQNGNVQRYFACRLPDLEEEEGAPVAGAPDGAGATGESGHIVRMMAQQQLQINAMMKKLQEMASNPFGVLDQILPVVDKIAKIGGRLGARGGGGFDWGGLVKGVLGDGLSMLRGDADDGGDDDQDDDDDDQDPAEVTP